MDSFNDWASVWPGEVCFCVCHFIQLALYGMLVVVVFLCFFFFFNVCVFQLECVPLVLSECVLFLCHFRVLALWVSLYSVCLARVIFTICAFCVPFHSTWFVCVIAEHSRDTATSGERGDAHAHSAASQNQLWQPGDRQDAEWVCQEEGEGTGNQALLASQTNSIVLTLHVDIKWTLNGLFAKFEVNCFR